MYNVPNKHFLMLVGVKIIDNGAILRMIQEEFNLPESSTEYGYDSHYISPGDIGGTLIPRTQQIIRVQIVYADGETLN